MLLVNLILVDNFQSSLVSIHDLQTNAFIRQISKNQQVLLGGTRNRDNIFSWNDGTTWLDQWPWNKWNKGEPAPLNPSKSNKYVHMTAGKSAKWSMNDNQLKTGYVCQTGMIFLEIIAYFIDNLDFY